MKTPQTVMGPVKTRGDFRQLSESSSDGVRRDSDTPQLPDDHPMWELWDTMTEFYGSSFVSQYGEEPTWAWFGSLRDLSVADYGVGIEGLRNRNSPFPPNPGEFVALCRPESPAQRRNREGFARAIAPIPLPREQALERLKAIRQEHGI